MARVLPVPMMNILNGGAHAVNNVDAQEFMVVPIGAETFAEALRMGVEVFHSLKKVLGKMGSRPRWATRAASRPMLPSNEAALDVVMQAIEAAGYEPGQDIAIALDVAASELFQDGEYVFKKGDGSRRAAEAMVDLYAGWVDRYPIVSIEDGLAEDDWDGLGAAHRAAGERIQLVGDDLFVTNVDRLARGIEEGVANAVLVKVNQIGTLTETLQCIELAQGSAYGAVISHRSGETEDTFIADLAVATGAGQIKTGAPPHRPHRPSTTSCSASRRSWATWRTTRDATSTRCDRHPVGRAGWRSRRARLRHPGRRMARLTCSRCGASRRPNGRSVHLLRVVDCSSGTRPRSSTTCEPGAGRRERFGMIRRGELLYRLVPADSTAR